LNEAISARRGQLQQLLSTGQRLSADGIVKESAELGEALSALRQQSDVLSRRAGELCSAAEQAVPLVAQFSSLNAELNDWLTAAEAETGRQPRPTLDRDSLREQQEAAKVRVLLDAIVLSQASVFFLQAPTTCLQTSALDD